jgi:Leucine-rich repeat (LRR) protein
LPFECDLQRYSMSKNCLYGLDGVLSLVALTTLDVSDNQIETLEALRGHPTVGLLHVESS